MKRLYSLVAALAFVGVNAMAADSAAPAMHFGVHAGVDFMTSSVSLPAPLTATTGTATGFLAGALLEAGLSDFLAVQPEVNFVTKGSTDGQNPATTTRANYIEVPVFVKAKYNMGAFKPFAGVGPSIGFLLSANQNPPNGGASTSVKDSTNTIDFGAQFMLGAAYAVTDSLDLFVDARYDLGLTNTIKNAAANTSAKNRGFMITAGVMF